MIASGVVRNALDLKKEDVRTRDRYKGVEQFLTTRRLIEAGREKARQYTWRECARQTADVYRAALP